ncbi:pentapeptide repeat-containing protein, partial [Geitlerinema sp. P-1104]|uniref:pentapeptide repeat-containing protein n=1 Tax=Geitlerinema sp. P-1104 TaxID=2546230 RepID=UPI0016AC9743
EGETALSALAREFIQRSQWKRRGDRAKSLAIFFIIPLVLSLIPLHFLIMARANTALSNGRRDFGSRFFIRYLWMIGESTNLVNIDASHDDFRGVALPKIELPLLGTRYLGITGHPSEQSKLNHSDFSYSNLKGAFIYKTDIIDATIMDASLENSFLWKVNFDNSDLNYTKFNNATLREVSFKNADISHANFSGSTLESINLQEVRHPTNLTYDQLQAAETICDVQFPPHISISSYRDCPDSID